MPDIYWTYRQTQVSGQMWCAGALEDQPHILMMEFNACRSAERDWEDVDMKPLYEYHTAPKRLREEQQAAQWRRTMGMA